MNILSEEKKQDALHIWSTVCEKREAALQLLKLGYFGDSLSRAYYSAFHAVTLIFYLNNQSFSSHQQLLGAFNKQFIHGGEIPLSSAKALGALFDARQAGDYGIKMTFEQTEAQAGLTSLEMILDSIKNYCFRTWGITLT